VSLPRSGRSLDPRERSRGRYVAGHWTHARLSKRPSGARRHGTERWCRCITEIGDPTNALIRFDVARDRVTIHVGDVDPRAVGSEGLGDSEADAPAPSGDWYAPALIHIGHIGSSTHRVVIRGAGLLTRSVRRPKGRVSKRMNPNPPAVERDSLSDDDVSDQRYIAAQHATVRTSQRFSGAPPRRRRPLSQHDR
jgi:hypothetical protein